jgi:hypothetical protein
MLFGILAGQIEAVQIPSAEMFPESATSVTAWSVNGESRDSGSIVARIPARDWLGQEWLIITSGYDIG